MCNLSNVKFVIAVFINYCVVFHTERWLNVLFRSIPDDYYLPSSIGIRLLACFFRTEPFYWIEFNRNVQSNRIVQFYKDKWYVDKVALKLFGNNTIYSEGNLWLVYSLCRGVANLLTTPENLFAVRSSVVVLLAVPWQFWVSANKRESSVIASIYFQHDNKIEYLYSSILWNVLAPLSIFPHRKWHPHTLSGLPLIRAPLSHLKSEIYYCLVRFTVKRAI